jgi:hypothetical protein
MHMRDQFSVTFGQSARVDCDTTRDDMQETVAIKSNVGDFEPSYDETIKNID